MSAAVAYIYERSCKFCDAISDWVQLFLYLAIPIGLPFFIIWMSSQTKDGDKEKYTIQKV